VPRASRPSPFRTALNLTPNQIRLPSSSFFTLSVLNHSFFLFPPFYSSGALGDLEDIFQELVDDTEVAQEASAEALVDLNDGATQAAVSSHRTPHFSTVVSPHDMANCIIPLTHLLLHPDTHSISLPLTRL